MGKIGFLNIGWNESTKILASSWWLTPLKFKVDPEKWWLEDDPLLFCR